MKKREKRPAEALRCRRLDAGELVAVTGGSVEVPTTPPTPIGPH